MHAPLHASAPDCPLRGIVRGNGYEARFLPLAFKHHRHPAPMSRGELALDSDPRINRLGRFDSLFGKPNVLFGGSVESDHVIACLRRFNGTFQRMNAIGVEEDRMFVLLAKARNQGNNFVDAEEVALPFGCANQHGHITCVAPVTALSQQDQTIEMADCDSPTLSVAHCLLECYHSRSAQAFLSSNKTILV